MVTPNNWLYVVVGPVVKLQASGISVLRRVYFVDSIDSMTNNDSYINNFYRIIISLCGDDFLLCEYAEVVYVAR